MINTVAIVVFALKFAIKGLTATGSGAKTTARHTRKTQMRQQFHRQMFLHRG